MVRAWYMDDNVDTDQRLEHQRSPPEFLQIGKLYEKTGVEYYWINPAHSATDAKLKEIRQSRGYTYEDEITCSEECLPDYANKLKSFFEEHLHTDEEIRLVLDGSGYFDVRDHNNEDRWVRIEVIAGDMIIIPKGIYHRFTLDKNNYIKAKRYFVGEPVWKPYNRPADNMECRVEYLKKLTEGFKEAELY